MESPPINGAGAKLCPSARCEPGALLLGVVQGDGSVEFLRERRRVDEFFVQLAREGRTPEKRFRFGDVCRKSGCQQWTGSRCGVIDRIAADNPGFRGNGPLPECGIREGCRWFDQIGESACAVCPHIITNMVPVEGAVMTGECLMPGEYG